MNPLELSLLHFVKPRVVHAIPGRLRLHIPSLKTWGTANGEVVSLVAQLLGLAEGIQEVLPCAITGNVLIRYDHERMTQTELLDYSQALFKMLVAHRNQLAKAWAEHPTQLVTRLSEWLEQVLARRLFLDADLRIPENVFV